jgi:TusA-related sulfurtransferase
MVHQIDLCGMISPITLLKVTEAFRRLDPGETLEIVGTDAQTKKDLFQVLEAPRYEFVRSQYDGVCYHILVKKMG